MSGPRKKALTTEDLFHLHCFPFQRQDVMQKPGIESRTELPVISHRMRDHNNQSDDRLPKKMISWLSKTLTRPQDMLLYRFHCCIFCAPLLSPWKR